MAIGTPLVMTANVVNGAAGTVATSAEPLSFQCPGKGAMLIDALCFRATGLVPHEVSIQLGRARLTNGYVPMTSIFQSLEERRWGDTEGGQNSGNMASTWRFDQPLYCPRSTRLSIMCRAAGANGNISFGLKCRLLPESYPAPKTVAVPWATVFRPTTSNFLADNTVTSLFNSIIGDVTNHFRTPLTVRRFVGAGVSADAANDGASIVIMAPPSAYAVQKYTTRVQIRDWLGNNIVRDATRLHHLCAAQRDAWETSFRLPSTRSLFVTFDERHPYAVAGPPHPFFAWHIMSSLALIGHRQEYLEEVAS